VDRQHLRAAVEHRVVPADLVEVRELRDEPLAVVVLPLRGHAVHAPALARARGARSIPELRETIAGFFLMR